VDSLARRVAPRFNDKEYATLQFVPVLKYATIRTILPFSSTRHTRYSYINATLLRTPSQLIGGSYIYMYRSLYIYRQKVSIPAMVWLDLIYFSTNEE
jgi:hypothetical protein